VNQIKARYIAVIVLAFILMLAAGLHFLVPAPPRNIVIAAGGLTGQYFQLATKLQAQLKKDGVEVLVLVTKGSIENIDLLNDPKSDVDFAFVQSGTSDSFHEPDFESIAGVFYEPLWVIYRKDAFTGSKLPDTIEELKTKKLSIGIQGSGTRKLVEKIFDVSHIPITTPNFYSFGTDKSYGELKKGDLDAIFISVSHKAPIMQMIFHDPNVEVMSFVKAYGYPSQIEGLQVVPLKRATLDIANDIPKQDTLLLSSTAEIVAKKNTHPAIVSLLIDGLKNSLSERDLLGNNNEFPSPNHLSFDANEDAQKVLIEGPSFFHRHLPFWFAVWVDRLIRVALPLLALLIPIVNFLPNAISYQTKLKFAKIYKELKDLEIKLHGGHFDEADISAKLTDLTERTRALKVSQFNTKDIYDLLSHIEDTQRRITEMHFGMT
jgi:hypothetical protein